MAAQADTRGLSRVRQALVDPPGVPERSQVAVGGPTIIEVELVVQEGTRRHRRPRDPDLKRHERQQTLYAAVDVVEVPALQWVTCCETSSPRRWRSVVRCASTGPSIRR